MSCVSFPQASQYANGASRWFFAYFMGVCGQEQR